MSKVAIFNAVRWLCRPMGTILIFCLITLTCHAQEMTLRFGAWPMVINVTFDASRVPAADVNRWMQLADYISNENGYQVPPALEDCPSNDARYTPCDGGVSINPTNARLNLLKIQAAIGDLDTKRFPADLAPVVAYLRQIQEFALWKESKRFEFFQTGNSARLESSFHDIAPKLSCRSELLAIRAALSKQEAEGLARHDWGNCVLREEMKKLGSYPQRDWESFLSAHGIREEIKQEDLN